MNARTGGLLEADLDEAQRYRESQGDDITQPAELDRLTAPMSKADEAFARLGDKFAMWVCGGVAALLVVAIANGAR